MAAATWRNPGFPVHRGKASTASPEKRVEGISFQRLQISEGVVHIRIRVLVQQFVMHRQRITNFHFHVGAAANRHVFARSIAKRNVESCLLYTSPSPRDS